MCRRRPGRRGGVAAKAAPEQLLNKKSQGQ
jgi:hypothetical protein